METASQTVVTPDNLLVKFQDMQVGAQIGARPTEMMQRQGGLKREVIHEYMVRHSEGHQTDISENGSRKAE